MADMLEALINEAKTRNGWSFQDIADRAEAFDGTGFSKATAANYPNVGMPTLVPKKIKALAASIGVPAYKVALAALADAGIEVPQSVESPEDAIRHDHTLSELTRSHLLAIIESERTRPLPRPRKRDHRSG